MMVISDRSWKTGEPAALNRHYRPLISIRKRLRSGFLACVA